MIKKVIGIISLFALLCACKIPFKINEKPSIIRNYSYYRNVDAIASGVKEISASTYILDTTFHQPHQFVVYYGQLEHSGILDYSIYEFIVVSDKDTESITAVRNQGTKVFQYFAFGSQFDDSEDYVKTVKNKIRSLKEQGLADGIFLDECDISYWDAAYQNNPEKQKKFYASLQEITTYIRSLDMESIINGTRSFATLGDYYLWESYLTYWATNQLKWDNFTSLIRSESSDGAITYGRRFNDWTFEGTTHVENGKVVGGQQGAMEILLDMDQILQNDDRRNVYDWVYAEWFGKGGSDETISISIWTGDTLPFDSTDWNLLPTLSKSTADNWLGISRSSKYIKVRIEFNEAKDLSMEQILLSFNYRFLYWDMSSDNGLADTNPYMWNYNDSQLDYLREQATDVGSPIKVLAHSYGEINDYEKSKYTFLSSVINEFYAWNYVHPMMQNADQAIWNEPLGMLLKRDKNGSETKGYFTGGTAAINSSNHTYTLTRNEPAYYYQKAIAWDDLLTDWNSYDQIYNNSDPALSSSSQFWGAYESTFSSGSFDNVQVVSRDGVSILELLEDGTGTWISQDEVIDSSSSKQQYMSELTWNYGGNGSAKYYIQYQNEDGVWTEWISQSSGTTHPSTEFINFRVKVELTGQASYETKDSTTGERIFAQGVSFWGSLHHWKIPLTDDVNITGIWLTDDRNYLYIKLQVAGHINFSTNENIVSDNFYNVYIDSDGEINQGFKGSWWNTPNMCAKFRITNDGFYRWKDYYQDQHSNEGWEWVGNSSMDYMLNATNNEIVYRIKKSNLGDLTKRDFKLYITADESLSRYGNFINPDQLIETEFNGHLSYKQKVFQPYVPHGFIQSEIISITEGENASLTWNELTPESTEIKAWIRTRILGDHSWNDWVEVNNGQLLKESFDRIQFSVGLYTDSGDITPQVSEINLSFKEMVDE